MRAPRRPSRHAGVVDRRTLTGCTATPPLCRQRQPGTFPICKSAEVVAELGYYNSTCSEGDTNECCEDYADVAVEPPLEPLPENVSGIGDGGSDDDECAGGLTIPGCSCNLWENTTYIASTGPPTGNPYMCGKIRTSDPRSFGPKGESVSPRPSNRAEGITLTDASAAADLLPRIVWPALHIISLNYPSRPTALIQYACSYFVRSLPIMIPCSHCGTLPRTPRRVPAAAGRRLTRAPDV